MGVAAIAVMFSTLLTLFDGAPRIMRQAIGIQENNRAAFLLMFALQAFGVLIIIQVFGRSFVHFINFATSVSFAAAPCIAFFNHRVIMSDDMPAADRPGIIMRLWSLVSLIALTVIAVYFFTSRLGLM